MKLRAACSVVLLLSFAMVVRAQETIPETLEEWYEFGSGSTSYLSVRPQLERLFDDSALEKLPAATMLDVVKEGAVKKVAPELVVKAVAAELTRLRIGKLILAEVSFHIKKIEERNRALKLMSIALQVGIPSDTLFDLMLSTDAKDTAFAVVRALSDVFLITEFSPEDAGPLGHSLIESRLDPSAYGSIASVFLKASVVGLSPEETATIITKTLAAGGGIIQIDQALTQRRRRR